MTSACRPLTAWRHLAALLCAASPFVARPRRGAALHDLRPHVARSRASRVPGG